MGFLRVPTAEHIESQLQKFRDYLHMATEGTHNEDAAVELLDTMEDRMATAPASAKLHYHHAYPGGWLDHTLNVVSNLSKMIHLYEQGGGTPKINRKQAVLCALMHDLGKLGDVDDPMYLVETSPKWIDLGFLYKRNPKFSLPSTNDLTIFLLQHFGFRMTQFELMAIKCTDGLYDEGNKAYFMGKSPFPFENNLPYLLHWADHMSTIIEKDETRPLQK
jgi:hypothetical protein